MVFSSEERSERTEAKGGRRETAEYRRERGYKSLEKSSYWKIGNGCALQYDRISLVMELTVSAYITTISV